MYANSHRRRLHLNPGTATFTPQPPSQCPHSYLPSVLSTAFILSLLPYSTRPRCRPHLLYSIFLYSRVSTAAGGCLYLHPPITCSNKNCLHGHKNSISMHEGDRVGD